jgi:hypothetical protein
MFIDKKTSMSDVGFPRLFLSRFMVFLSDESPKALQAKENAKSRVKNILQKNRPQISKPARGVRKHHQRNIGKMCLALAIFSPLAHPPTTRDPDFVFYRPHEN